MKLYTKTGDDGTTGLTGGKRIAKDAPRMVAIGTVDELNAHLALAAAASKHEPVTSILTVLQSRLFDLGADLADDASTRIGDRQVQQAEQWIDQASEPVAALQCFILPGGSELAARLHVARAVARRAERTCVTLEDQSAVVFLNRVSDLMFAMARWANHLEGVEDVPWRGGEC